MQDRVEELKNGQYLSQHKRAVKAVQNPENKSGPTLRPSRHPFITIGLFLPLCTALFVSCGRWVMPKILVGRWAARQEVTVRYQTGFMSYRFVRETVQVVMIIQEDGNVKGTLGGARFEECVLSQNRGWFGRTFNLFSDYIVTGKLLGIIS